MLSLEEFQTWNLNQGWSKTTTEVITDIRNAPPARRVRSRVGNVSGRYPSRKMGVTIQFESHTVDRLTNKLKNVKVLALHIQTNHFIGN